MMMHRWLCGLMAISLLCILVGCNSKPQTVQVEGIVKLDGKPLEGASVLFFPMGKNSQAARGTTDSAGVFHLSTFAQEDGAIPGEYKVLVTKTDASQPQFEGIDENYQKWMKGKKRAAKSPIIHPVYANEATTPLTFRIPASGSIVLEVSQQAPLEPREKGR